MVDDFTLAISAHLRREEHLVLVKFERRAADASVRRAFSVHGGLQLVIQILGNALRAYTLWCHLTLRQGLLVVVVAVTTLLLGADTVSILTLVLLLRDLHEEEVVDVVIAVDARLRVVLEDLVAVSGAIQVQFCHLLCEL